MDSQIPGPDGFLFSPTDRLRMQYHRLDEYLVAEEERPPDSPFNLVPWRRLGKEEIPRQIEAALLRLRWLDEHDAELENAHRARLRLTTLLRVLYKQKGLYSESDLRAILDATTPLLGRIAPYGPVEKVIEYLEKADLTREMCDSLRRFQANLREEMSQSQASMQSLRQQLYMLLWMDEWEPLDPARCWSECIRRDFRRFEDGRRVRWRALFKHLRGNAPVRMPAGWAKGGESLLAAVGLEDFREQIELWFAPFQSGEPLPLSVPGSHVLKGLVWFSALTRDESLKQICLWLLDAKWRQKRNTEKALVALSVFGVTKQELLARDLIKTHADHSIERFMEKIKQASAPRTADHVQADSDGESIIVQGQLHFYRLTRLTGKIERVSDRVELELDWPSVPDSLRLLLNRQCDSPQQLDLRARLLVHDSIFGRYFKAR